MTRPAVPFSTGRAILAGGAMLALAACSVVDSQRIDLRDAAALAYNSGQVPCHSTLGSYSLPKAFLRVRVGQAADRSTPPDIHLDESEGPPIKVVRRPDSSLMFCLDHLASPFADEVIKVEKWTPGADTLKGSFLGAVTINVTDQTSFIVRALLRAAFMLITGDPGFTPRSATYTPQLILADLEFDPFNRTESAEINSRLTKLGFCVVMEKYTFGPGIGVDRYCSDPLRYGREHTMFYKAYVKAEEKTVDPHYKGILYRPRHPYRVMIFRKPDPGGGGRWKLEFMTTVELENLSPVLALGVTRGAFAGKKVSFVFEEGTLKISCVAKTSETEGFVTIPLEIARSIVSVPASIVSVRIGHLEDQKKLIDAQNNLYKMQQYLLAKLAGEELTHPGGPKTADQKPGAKPEDYLVPKDLLDSKQVAADFAGDNLFKRSFENICSGKG